MTIQELKKRIKENNLPKFLIFTGEEWKVQHEYIKQIAKVKKLSTVHADDIDVVWREINARSLFGSNTLYVLRDDKELMTNEKIYSHIEDVLNDNMLILVLTTVDKRLKILKQYKDSIVEFNTLNEAILKQYIQKQIALSDSMCDLLIEVCNHNYGYILLEIDKLWKYIDYVTKDETNVDVDADAILREFIHDGTIYTPPRDTMWDFIRAFLQDKPLIAYELYQDLKDSEAPTLVILSNLYTEAKHVLQVQTCRSADIAKSTGLTAWQIKNAKACVGKIRSGDLAYLMRLIQKVESGIKTGRIEESIAIDYIFTQFF